MTDTNKDKQVKDNISPQDFLKELREYAITVGEDCPEGHRRDPGSGRCLPFGSTDHTAFTRSLNDDQGPEWRGLVDKDNTVFDQASTLKDLAIDADQMDELESCAQGTTFSFVQRRCVTLEEAEAENAGAFAFEEEAKNGHEGVVDSDPAGRRDPIGFECPENMFFDFKRRECIPLNKDTVMASEEETNGDEAAGDDTEANEDAKELTYDKRKSLPDSAFGVPGKRKFPLHDCSHVRNAMARFNQAKGLTSGEKATLRRKILARAKQCGINVENFGKANTEEEFAAVFAELMVPFRREINSRLGSYRSKSENMKKSPCPPGMEWDAKTKRCTKMRGFYEALKSQASHSDIISKDPAGRRDTVNFECPPNHLFDFKNRKCIPMDTRMSPGQPGDTTKASEDAAQRDLAPSPKGRPARLPQDCPKGTIWDGRLRKCRPLDPPDGASPPKGKASEEAQAPASGPGKEKDDHGCLPYQAWNPKTEKCESRKGQFKGKSGEEKAVNSKPANREGLVGAPAGKVKHPTDCPPGTLWDGKNKLCRPLDSMDKSRPDGNSPQDPANTASVENVVANMSLAKLISHLDAIIKEELLQGRKEKAKVEAKDLPNEAFPPSLVGSTRRSLMHHDPEVTDPYDSDTVDVPRLRNALARVSKVEGYSDKAVEEAREHLIFHARQIVSNHLGK